ncbi:uncharacterized protein LOC121626297 isoform X1 [Chelmon rostratus]|uniref:uncharacterized protein LOC121626297 isoform X1 n=1 Tax=Chelmon rostratus TaxID=109905 RepID=UPI001BE5D716|nr:uncharacterized protein LOC121626297 isoform X1 [Chelmon rostratus]
MKTLWFALYLTFLSSGRIAQTADLKSSSYELQEGGFVSANVGDNVTLQCFCEGDAVQFNWYKQTLGQKPRLISTYYKYDKNGKFHDEFENNRRFTLDTETGHNHLNITDLHSSDSATYYCARGDYYSFEFTAGFIVSVKGSGVNIPALVHQSASVTIQPGGSKTLNCTVHTGTCDGEHSVYWFRNSEEPHPGLIYTHGGRNDQCEWKPNTQTHTCVSNWPMKSLNLSHAGIYYCAVVSCGHIVFGNGTKLDFEDEVESFVLVYVLSGALAFTTILVVLLAYAAYTMKNRNSCQCADSRSSAALTPNAVQDDQDSENLHYAALREHRINRTTRRKDNTQNDCVYSSVRQ